MSNEIAISKPLFNREEFLKLKTPQEKEEYLRGVNLIRVDLSGLDFSYVDLSDLDFSFADFWRANLSFANCGGANFRSAILPKHKFATISGYQIFIFETHIQIGCYFFYHEEFLQGNSRGFKALEECEKEFFIQNKEEIIKLIKEFNLNKGA